MADQRNMTEPKPVYKLTRHAEIRCAQRCYRNDDISLIIRYGTPTAEGVLMRKKDVLEAVQDLRLGHMVPKLKREFQMVQRLAGTLIITAEDSIVTVQRADVAKQRRQLRRTGYASFTKRELTSNGYRSERETFTPGLARTGFCRLDGTTRKPQPTCCR